VADTTSMGRADLMRGPHTSWASTCRPTRLTSLQASCAARPTARASVSARTHGSSCAAIHVPSPGLVADGEASSDAYVCVWTAPRRTWRRTGAPALRGADGGATPTPSPNGPRQLDRSRRRPPIRSRRAHARRFRRRPAAVAAFVYAAIGVPLTVANDAGAELVRGVVLLLAAVAAGTASVNAPGSTQGDGTSAPSSGPVPRACDQAAVCLAGGRGGRPVGAL
jgi:hypothetical protein